MLIRNISASTFVIAAALAGSQAWAQDSAAPAAAPTTSDPASAAPAPAEPAAPAAQPTPAQPDTTAIPASEPAASPRANAGPAEPATQTAQPGSPPAEPTSTAPAPAQQAQAEPAQPASGATQVAAFVDSQFPALDADKDGALTTTEFEGWITRLKTAELEQAGKPVNAQEVKTYAQNALRTADKDSDKKVSKAEATQFFSGAA